MPFPGVANAARVVTAIFLLAFMGCAPSAEERQAEALLAKAQELSLTGGKYQPRWAAHMQAEKIYKEIVSLYPKTNAAKAATKGLERMPAVFEADLKVAAEELGDKYQATIMEAVSSPQR